MNGQIGVQESKFLEDDLIKVALSLDSHPMIVYPNGLYPHSLNVSDTVSRSWSRLSGSSTFLPQYGVFLAVTRIIFYSNGFIDQPIISFLRGQIYDQDWNHLNGYNLTWKNKTMIFPTIFDVPAEFEEGGSFYGPEDPRIIIEEGVLDAEPVIVFNMITDGTDWLRSMWVYRPFSGHATVLTIRGEERAATEKNWAPIFLSLPQRSATDSPKAPSQHLHFVYSFHPLRILYCELDRGDCDWAFWQHVPKGFKTAHQGDPDDLRGGTNFVPIPLENANITAVSTAVHAYISIPRTHIDGICSRGVYRPMLLVLVNVGEQWFYAFASSSIDFGDSILTQDQLADPCNSGRVLIANSIAYWDHRDEGDVMTITFSVGDRTVQVARVTGIEKFIWNLPHFQQLVTGGLSQSGENFLLNMQYSATGYDVEACAVEAATNYTWKAKQMSEEVIEPELTIHEMEEQREKEQGERQHNSDNVDAVSSVDQEEKSTELHTPEGEEDHEQDAPEDDGAKPTAGEATFSEAPSTAEYVKQVGADADAGLLQENLKHENWRTEPEKEGQHPETSPEPIQDAEEPQKKVHSNGDRDVLRIPVSRREPAERRIWMTSRLTPSK